MENSFEVTVAVLTYKNNSELRCCLQSIDKQLVDFSFEVIVIDNSSGEAEVVLSEFVGIKYFINKKNSLGLARAYAVENAASSLIAFLDSDCVAPRNWLQTLVNEYRYYNTLEAPALAAVGSGNRPPSAGRFYDSLLLMRKVYWGHLSSAQQKLFSNVCFVEHLPTTNVLYNRFAIINSGNFNPNDTRVGEDLDLSFRLRRLGYRLMYTPNAVVEHYEVDTLWEWTARAFRFGHAQIKLLFRYWHPATLSERIIFPQIFFSAMFLSILCAFQSPVSLFIVAAYLGFILVSSILLCFVNKKTRCILLLFSLFVSTHVSYSMGQMVSLFRHAFGRGG